MNKQSISFKADEQKLTKTGGIEHYASNIVAYIEATFDLGANWNGYDSVRAVWSNDYLTDISTVLDPNGKCIVPTEVLTDTGNVTVNLVGSIADGDTLTDRLTTYPCKAVVVDADAKVEGEETESITPSQFEQFVEIVHDEVEQVTGMTAEAETLPAGSDATASYADGVLSLGIPKGDKGEQGEQGETGHTGAPAGFGDVTASVDNTVGIPSVNVTASGPDTAKEFDFEFHNLKGEQGDTGETGETGNGIASTVLNPDYTLTIRFTDGTSYTTPPIRGAKGDTGDTGATGNGIQSTVLNADYTLTITFTDGTSYTTPSIRGEQGPAGPVSDVTVNGTSVVDQNGVAVITMPELVKTVTGNPIVLDDAFGEVKNLDVELTPIQDLHGYDKPWAGGANSNKWNEQWEQGTIVEDGDRASTVSIRSKGYNAVSANTAYCFITPNAVSARNKVIFFYDSNQQFLSKAEMTGDINVVTTPNGCAYMRFVVTYYYQDIGEYNNDIAFNYPSTVTTYSPYSNICPITGHDSVTVTDTGINQWDEVWEVGGIANANGQPFSTNDRIRSVNYCRCNGGTAYYLKAPTNYLSVFYYDANKTYLGYWNAVANNVVTFNADASYFKVVLAGNVTTYANNISINYPSTDTAYHAYHGQSKTITLPHTVYGAGVGVTSGEGTETMAFADLGDATWNYNTSLGGIFIATSATLPAPPKTAFTGVCTIYSYGGAYTVLQDQQFGYVYGDALCVKDSRFTDATAFKQAMSGVKLCYEKATPTDLSTTPTDLTLYNGDNVISSDGDMELSYVQDMAIVIRKIENQL